MSYCNHRCSDFLFHKKSIAYSSAPPFPQKSRLFWGPRPFGLLQSSLLLHISFSPKSGFLGAPALWAIAVVAAPSRLLFSKKRFFGGPGSLSYCSRRCSFTPPFLQKAVFLGAPALWAIAVVAAPSHLLFSKKRLFGGPGSLSYCSRRCSFTSPFLQKAVFLGPRLFGLLQC